MPDLSTPRLRLHAVDEPAARRVLARRGPAPGERWADDYPFDGDLVAAGQFLKATEAHGEQRPFGYYQIIETATGLVIGGAGFKEAPRDDAVEIGYGLAPTGRGHGYAAEAVTALVGVAAEQGVATVRADTTVDNVASQRTLVRAGFALVRTDADLQYYAIGP